MSDLTRFRDHARTRADWRAGDLKAACRDMTAFGTPKPRDHGNCGGGTCGCRCHAPTDAERVLWRRLADEVDAYLAGDPETVTTPAPDDAGLWTDREDAQMPAVGLGDKGSEACATGSRSDEPPLASVPSHSEGSTGRRGEEA